DGDGVGDHVAARHLVERLQMHEAWRTNLHAVRLVGTIGHQVNAELALGVFDACIGLACWHMEAFGEQLEVMDQIFHAGLHFFTLGWRNLVVVSNDRTRVIAQPLYALSDDACTFTHFADTYQIAVIAVAINANRDIEIYAIIDFVGLHFAQVPLIARTTQHG